MERADRRERSAAICRQGEPRHHPGRTHGPHDATSRGNEFARQFGNAWPTAPGKRVPPINRTERYVAGTYIAFRTEKPDSRTERSNGTTKRKRTGSDRVCQELLDIRERSTRFSLEMSA